MADLRQVLSQGRKRIALLVGAGAPLSVRVNTDGKLDSKGSPLIPGVDQLTTRVLGNLSSEYSESIERIREDISSNLNIETFLSKVRLLQQAVGKSKIHGLDSAGYGEMAKEICANIGSIVGASLPQERNAYSELVAWIGGASRAHPIEIFTTNYDLLFEEAFERSRNPYFDGFSGGKSPFFDPVTVSGNDLPARWSRLWKLHGSLGWELINGSVIRGGNRATTELVYPDHLKYDLTQKQPYAALFERLKQFLTSPDTLLIAAGFSFRDSHICAVIDECLAINANSSVFAFQFNDLENEQAAVQLALDRPNLSVYATDGAVIGGIDGRWHPGELPNNWKEIRATFWGERWKSGTSEFLLGDFNRLARFFSQAQAPDLRDTPTNEPTPESEH